MFAMPTKKALCVQKRFLKAVVSFCFGAIKSNENFPSANLPKFAQIIPQKYQTKGFV